MAYSDILLIYIQYFVSKKKRKNLKKKHIPCIAQNLISNGIACVCGEIH